MKDHMQHLNHQQIAELLTSGTNQLDDGVIASLRQAKTMALTKQAARTPIFTLAAISQHAHSLMMPHSTGRWLVSAVLLASFAVGGTGYWHHQQEHQKNHLDLAILIDDMPMDVFID